MRDKRTADELVGLNNWGRIFPLPAICEDASAAGDVERVPQWRTIPWTKTQLEELVLATLGEIPKNLTEIQDGGNPLDTLAAAREILRSEQFPVFRNELSPSRCDNRLLSPSRFLQ